MIHHDGPKVVFGVPAETKPVLGILRWMRVRFRFREGAEALVIFHDGTGFVCYSLEELDDRHWRLGVCRARNRRLPLRDRKMEALLWGASLAVDHAECICFRLCDAREWRLTQELLGLPNGMTNREIRDFVEVRLRAQGWRRDVATGEWYETA